MSPSKKDDLSRGEIRKRFDQEVADVLLPLLGLGWRVTPHGHGGRLWCPHNDRNGCHRHIPGTAKNAGHAAKTLERFVATCHHESS